MPSFVRPALVLAALLPAFAPPAGAAIVQIVQNPAGICRSALPVYDGGLRNRPLAVANIGSSDAFVSCSMEDRYSGQSTWAGVWLVNTRTTPVTVTCSHVPGNQLSGAPRPAYTKSRTYAAGAGDYISWLPAEIGRERFSNSMNFSCQLPPGVEIRMLSRNEWTP